MSTSSCCIIRRSLLFFLCLFSAAFVAAQDKSVSIQGNVDGVISPTRFQVGTNTIVCEPETPVILKYGGKSVTVSCESEAIHSGMKVTVNGKRDSASGQIIATSVTAIVYEATLAKEQQGDPTVSGTALIEKMPKATKTSTGWTGNIDADGRKIRFTTFTKIVFVPNKSERAQAGDNAPSSIKSLGDIGPDVFVSYKGLPFRNGTMFAERLVFMRNCTNPEKLKLREEYEPKITEPDYAGGKPGKLVIKSLDELPIVPNKTLQEKVSETGHILVPAFQKSLSDADPMKIHFRFYVVKTEKFAISSFPNGVVLVSAELLPRLQNEAQLAAVLAADIALVMQEKIYELRTRRNVQNAIGWGALGTVVGAAAASVPVVGAPADILLSVNSVAWSDLIMSLERQAGRLALEYMLDAGYDPREAEGAFISLTRKSTIGPKLRLAERQYYQVMEGEVSQQLKQAYGDVKFSELKRDTEEYKKLLAH